MKAIFLNQYFFLVSPVQEIPALFNRSSFLLSTNSNYHRKGCMGRGGGDCLIDADLPNHSFISPVRNIKF